MTIVMMPSDFVGMAKGLGELGGKLADKRD